MIAAIEKPTPEIAPQSIKPSWIASVILPSYASEPLKFTAVSSTTGNRE
jgi:hypothetical protein